MTRWIVILVLVFVAWALLPGCGNVTLKGEALTAAENSTLDAYQASQRYSAQAASQPALGGVQGPAWVQPYFDENFKQWRFFVRSARKDLNWGPKLEGE